MGVKQNKDYKQTVATSVTLYFEILKTIIGKIWRYYKVHEINV